MSYHYSKDPEEDLPDWLKALRKQRGQAPKEGEEVEESKQAEEELPSESAPQEPGAGDEPDWLLEIRRRHQRESPAAAPGSTSGENLGESQSPDVVDDATEVSDTQPLASHREPGPKEPPEDRPAQSDELLPDWLIEDGETDSSAPAASKEEALEEEALPGELPSWLQELNPPEEPEEEPQVAAKSATEEAKVGPLAGLSGVLPAEPEIVQFGAAPAYTGRLEITPSQKRHVAALEKMLAAEGQPKEDQSRRGILPSRLLRLVIASAMLIATAFPLFAGSQSAPRTARQAYPESSAIFNQIQLLPPNVSVLVAFEVQPALFGELQAVASPLLDHLIDQQARLVFISTQPTGPALVERLLRQQLKDKPAIATGNYVNLGYLSGGIAALRQLATDPLNLVLPGDQWQAPSLQNIEQISDFGLVLVISGDAEDARAWIEQVGPHSRNGLLIATSAQAFPLLLPYTKSQPPSLRGLVAGLNGAAHYELLTGKGGLAKQYWDSYSYGLGATLILILLGGLSGRLISLRPTSKTPDQEEAEHGT